eukprot:CAMPEP_0176162464 /NCGR_PEP_ID=MMETSP0120_2-20121206/83120_1 /TAXON_ID=160619 /ORGANISM="Kryptoperidinium foliaceum, Strain CCMP 1326" /LENGTH=66 /DNA_ID=CAMNT_0017499973 /DNA_START=231 /DNA_END=431 /DNA_ORIENTATION=-
MASAYPFEMVSSKPTNRFVVTPAARPCMVCGTGGSGAATPPSCFTASAAVRPENRGAMTFGGGKWS